MANTSIFNAFERMWQHANNAIDNAIDAIESDILVVTVDTTNNTASHSASEIKDAYDAGKLVVMWVKDKIAHPYLITSTIASFNYEFTGAYSYSSSLYTIDDNKSLTIGDESRKYFLPSYNENTNGKYLRSTEAGGEWVDLPSYATMDDVNSAISTAITSAIGGSY